MDKNKQANYFLLFALSVSFLVVYFIAEPFLGPLILAAVFAFLFQPIYQRLFKFFKKRAAAAAMVTTIIAVIMVLIPISFLGSQIFKESSQVYQSLIANGGDFEESVRGVIDQVRAILPIPDNFEIDLSQYARQSLEVLVRNVGAIFSSFAKLLLNSFVFILAFYFFLKDGGKLKDYFIELSPLNDKDDELILSRLKLGVASAIKGNLTIGLIQGTLTGIGFAIFGVPNAALWGAVAAIAALLPGIGTALVITPAIIYLFLTGNIFGGFGLLIWGFTAVGLIDNLLGPRLVSQGMHLHPLIIFIAVLGGLAFFGPLGFLLGPLAISVFIALVDIYGSLKSKNLTKANK